METFEDNLNKILKKNDEENLLLFLKSSDKNNIQLTNTTDIKAILKYNNDFIRIKATELIAECAKDQTNRLVLSEKELIQLLLTLLDSDDNITFNAVRALGNIFYENEDATNLLEKNDFDIILKKFFNLEKGVNILLLSKISGLLLNIFISNENLHFIDKNDLLNHILFVIDKHSISTNSITDPNLIILNSYLLQIVYTLMVEYDDQIIYSESLHKKVIDILENSKIPELELICLQILYNASEKENVQLLLAELNVCEKIFELVEKYKSLIEDEESRSILKMACDLVNNILINDASMKLLYDRGRGKVYLNCIQWLDSEDEDLLGTAIMAVGNFARNDENCISIVKEGISRKLIDLLSKYYGNNPNIKLLHGLLSSLKNLVVPKINKAIILEEGFLSSIDPLLEMDEDIVIFKLLGTLRLVIDGQETAAKDLISKKLFLEKLVKWYDNSHHLGVKLEIPRLLAWLIKNCHSWESIQKILEIDGPVVFLVSMFSSDDAIMENEALLSLNLLAESFKQNSNLDDLRKMELKEKNAKFVNQIIKTDIATVLPYIRIFSHSEQMLENLIGLLERLFEYKEIREHFKDKNVIATLEEHSKITNSKSCLDRIEKLISILSS